MQSEPKIEVIPTGKITLDNPRRYLSVLAVASRIAKQHKIEQAKHLPLPKGRKNGK